jgi:hypothetical protein
MLFMTWAYSDKPEMIGILADEYVRAGKENDIPWCRQDSRSSARWRVVPDSRCMLPTAVIRVSPEPILLPALCWHRSYGIDPRGNRYTAGLDAADAAYLQQVAWDTVREFGRVPPR